MGVEAEEFEGEKKAEWCLGDLHRESSEALSLEKASFSLPKVSERWRKSMRVPPATLALAGCFVRCELVLLLELQGSLDVVGQLIESFSPCDHQLPCDLILDDRHFPLEPV
jgi:hypothetical protein